MTTTDKNGTRYDSGPTIITTAGYFDFGDYSNSDPLEVRDVAHALSHLCRFTGWCRSFYSVAEHSVYVRRHVAKRYPNNRRLALAALLHDAGEALTNDMSKPFKGLNPEYRRQEHAIEAWLMPILGVPELTPDERVIIKEADVAVYAAERLQIMPRVSDAIAWITAFAIQPYDGEIECIDSKDAYARFMREHEDCLRLPDESIAVKPWASRIGLPG